MRQRLSVTVKRWANRHVAIAFFSWLQIMRDSRASRSLLQNKAMGRWANQSLLKCFIPWFLYTKRQAHIAAARCALV